MKNAVSTFLLLPATFFLPLAVNGWIISVAPPIAITTRRRKGGPSSSPTLAAQPPPQPPRAVTVMASSQRSATSSSAAAPVVAAPTSSLLSSSLLSSSSSSSTAAAWFPQRVQETVPYSDMVDRLYLRHLVAETQDVALMARAQLYPSAAGGGGSATATTTRAAVDVDAAEARKDAKLQLSAADPFGDLARRVSVCKTTREEGGKIGWVDRVHRNIGSDSDADSLEAPLLPPCLVNAVYAARPKAGDVLVLENAVTRQWHCIQVVELWVQPLFQALGNDGVSSSDEAEQRRVGSFGGENLVLPRKQLKGSGAMPSVATLLPNNSKESDDDDDDATATTVEQKSYYIQTAGCQMNVADAERLEGILQHDLGLRRATTSHPRDADVVLFHTCSIREKAQQRLYDALGPWAVRKRSTDAKPLTLIVTGCVAQQEGRALLRQVPEIDVVLGPQYVPFLRNVLDRVSWGHQVVATAPMLLTEGANAAETEEDVGDGDASLLASPPVRGHDVRAWVNVIHGCNEHCTYCVVPSTRGMEQSRPAEAILAECLDLAARGYKEVTLLGQNIDAYGRDCVPKRNFADLLHFLNDNIPTKMRIRYTTSHPRYFSDRVIRAVANLDKVCELFHMPFQAGDDDVLKSMRRGYTYASYMKIINKIRDEAPDSAICADVIVGFPGETDEAFEKTLQLMDEVKFDNLNSFAYSRRPWTEAALREDQVPEEVKSERLQRVQKLAARHGLERSERYLGRTVEVLVEDANPRNPERQVMGRTRQGRQVYFDGDLEGLRGEFVQVLITEARTWSLMGEMVK